MAVASGEAGGLGFGNGFVCGGVVFGRGGGGDKF